jgi:hypothetical protein
MPQRIFTLLFLIILSAAPCYAQSGQVKGCRMTSRTLTLRKSDRWTPVKGIVPASGKIEYRVKPTSNLVVELVARTTIIKVDVYSLNPATKLATRAEKWKDTLFAGKEYALVLSNCYSTSSNAFHFDIRGQ